MNNQNNQFNPNPNQSLDYESWVNSLGNIHDGIFQNTPITNHIINHPIGSAGHNSIINHNINNNIIINNSNSNNNGPNANGQGINGIPNNSDLNIDLFFNSPERFYRDIINESPILNRTPQVGRTPLRALNFNFSTPNFLKNIETSNSAIKNFTPLKNQLFNSTDLFQTPRDNNQNSTLNSSPTTIKMNSSATKNDENNVSNKAIPPSPTPTSKLPNKVPNINNRQPLPSIPKMGYFKKTDDILPNKQSSIPPHLQPQPPKRSNGSNTKFQIIMTDVNSFANSSKNKNSKKKKLTRSSTTINASTTTNTLKTISKKSNLKRSLSQPHTKFNNKSNVSTPRDLSNVSTNSIDSQQHSSYISQSSQSALGRIHEPTTSPILHQSNASQSSELVPQSRDTDHGLGRRHVMNQKSNDVSVEDIFNDRILTDEESW